MCKLVLLLFIPLSISGYAQRRIESGSSLITNDSLLLKTKRLEDSVTKVFKEKEIQQMNESNQRNIEALVVMQKERKANEKRNAFIRIGIGVAFFIILIIGLRRRRVAKK